MEPIATTVHVQIFSIVFFGECRKKKVETHVPQESGILSISMVLWNSLSIT